MECSGVLHCEVVATVGKLKDNKSAGVDEILLNSLTKASAETSVDMLNNLLSVE